VRSSAIRPEEEALRTQLDATEEELVRGGAGRGKMNELWGVVGQLAALRQAGQAPGMNGGPGQEVEWRVVDPEGLETIARVRLSGVVSSGWSLLIQGSRFRFYLSSSKALRILPSYYKMIYGTWRSFLSRQGERHSCITEIHVSAANLLTRTSPFLCI
jgi:hypothetical protein